MSTLSAAALSKADLQRLTLFKWTYALEAKGFPIEQVKGLMFLRWLAARGKIGGAS